MAFDARVAIRDKREVWDRLRRDLSRWQDVEVAWGLLRGTDPRTIYKGLVNEFGSPAQGIPARPWLRRATDRNTGYVFRQAQGVARAFFAARGNQGWTAPLERVAVTMQKRVTQSILGGRWQKNAPFTVRKKGFNWPLVETHKLGSSPSGWPELLRKLRGNEETGPPLADSVSARVRITERR